MSDRRLGRMLDPRRTPIVGSWEVSTRGTEPLNQEALFNEQGRMIDTRVAAGEV